MNYTLPSASSTGTSTITSGSVPTSTTCTCSVSDALHWTMLISESAFLGDEDMRRPLPAALAHFDLIAAAA